MMIEHQIKPIKLRDKLASRLVNFILNYIASDWYRDWFEITYRFGVESVNDQLLKIVNQE
jgi:hypothetical protein